MIASRWLIRLVIFSIAFSLSPSKSIFLNVGSLYGSGGFGSIVSRLRVLCKFPVFAASAKGNTAHVRFRMHLLPNLSRNRCIGCSLGSVFSLAMLSCALCLRRRYVGGTYASTSRVWVATVLNAERVLSSAVLCTEPSDLRCICLCSGCARPWMHSPVAGRRMPGKAASFGLVEGS